jgi:MbtH protein
VLPGTIGIEEPCTRREGHVESDGSSDGSSRYVVVVNEEDQYSIWFDGRSVPAGWLKVGVSGTKDECLDHIERVWTDMRPRSVRQHMDRMAGGQDPV